MVIATYQRGEILLESIRLLQELQPIPLEILIIDQTQNHDPNIAQALNTLGQTQKIRWIRLPRPSIPKAMNTGLQLAQGDTVLFLDDDIIPNPNLIKGHLQAHQQAHLVVGQVIQPNEQPLPLQSGEPFRFNSTEPCFIQDCMAGNLSIKTTIARQLGGFDENFQGAAFKFESEFAHRYTQQYGPIYFEPTASIHHLMAQRGGTRAHGHHLRTAKPTHSLGAYYYLLKSRPPLALATPQPTHQSHPYQTPSPPPLVDSPLPLGRTGGISLGTQVPCPRPPLSCTPCVPSFSIPMNIAIDALPTNHLSGQHVLLGHLKQIATAHHDRHQFYIFHHKDNRHLCRNLAPNVHWIDCSPLGESWSRRLLWELLHLNSKLEQIQADWLISTSGALVPGVKIPQIVLAQNPWCYFPQFHTSWRNRAKAWGQRLGYRHAQRHAAAIFYLSQYVADTYHRDADCFPQHGAVLYVGVDDDTFTTAAQNRIPFEQRSLEVLVVSAMTPHKAVEDVVAAVAQVHQQGIPAQLTLVGPWSSDRYRHHIETLAQHHHITNFLTITGKVSTTALHEHYAKARAFCLLSRCESFGIPAIEAQAFGTPTVVADVCAPPEVAGPGGVVVPVGAIDQTTTALTHLLQEGNTWSQASQKALENAERFRWSQVAQPLVEFLDNL
ncbi:MAG: glycosyltransferase [Nodosilinea sp. LVE1205-7]